jgi:prepilin-type N-terminal cleavage/methylation domain-containing protein
MGIKRTLKQGKGFSLFEMLLVMVVLSTVFFPLVALFAKGLLASQEVKGTNFATIIAQKKIEEIRVLSFSAITSETLRSVEGYPVYQRIVTVTTPLTNLKNIKVTIFWKMGEGSTIYVTEETQVSNF